jgi:hypothetical protein
VKVNNETAEAIAQNSLCNLEYIHALLKVSEICWPLKESIVKYFYDAWLIIGKRNLYKDNENLSYLWKIIESLVNDIEYNHQTEDAIMRRYKFPNK